MQDGRPSFEMRVSIDECPADAVGLLKMPDGDDAFDFMRIIRGRAVADNQPIILFDRHIIGDGQQQTAVGMVGDDALSGTGLGGGKGAKTADDVTFLTKILAKFKINFKGLVTCAVDPYRMLPFLEGGYGNGIDPAAGSASDRDHFLSADKVFLPFWGSRRWPGLGLRRRKCHSFALAKYPKRGVKSDISIIDFIV